MYKIFILVLILCVSKILPTNQEVQDLAQEIRNQDNERKEEFKEYLKEKSESEFEKMI